MSEKYIELGYCSKPHGIKGAFSFVLSNPTDSALKKGSEILLKPTTEKSSLDEKGEKFKIKKIQFGNKVIVELVNVLDRNKVEELVPFSIWLNREDFPPLQEGEYYLNDLIGFKVFDQNESLIGVVESLGTNGVQDIIRIKGSDGSAIEVLFIENFVKQVNLEDCFILVTIAEIV